MLVELDVRDFAIIDHVKFRVAPGLAVLTGETGAGKSLIVDAVGQLLGDRADTELVRAGARRAEIEGLFEPGPRSDRVNACLQALGIPQDEQLILRREIHAGGRSTARVNGRAVPIRALAEIGALLVDIHGQSENVSLKREAEHVELLDRYAGLQEQRAQLAELVGRAGQVTAELVKLRAGEVEARRRVELLDYQIDEIEAARLSVDEEAALIAERSRLGNAEKLAVLADAAYSALRGGDGDQLAALDLVGLALESVARLTQIDPELEGEHESLLEAEAMLSDAATRLLAYRDQLDFSPRRLEEVEERLGLISDLKRKYGPDVAAVLAHAVQAAADLESIASADDRICALTTERETLVAQIGALAAELSARRREAALRLSRAVEVELDALGMPGSRFEVEMTRRADADGVPVDGELCAFDATGVDKVRFLVSTNPGEPPRPLVRVASGGETSRLMLALKGILTAADRVPTLIFDEIDAGIGGRVGAVVGKKLWWLAGRHQVLCVTHLPQVAAYADTHYCVQKAVARERTTAELSSIAGEERVNELTSMLGRATSAARQNAVELLQHSELWKVTQDRDAEQPD